MDCCKEEDCCPCDKLQERIDCLQAQINELEAARCRMRLDIASIMGFVANKDAKTLNKFKRYQNKTHEMNGQPGPNKLTD